MFIVVRMSECRMSFCCTAIGVPLRRAVTLDLLSPLFKEVVKSNKTK
jgi:hypothetical protein